MNPFRVDFPILAQTSYGKPLIYLDSAATTQRPTAVINAVQATYTGANANPHRGVYHLAELATQNYENAREKVARFVGASSACEIIFTKNTSESLNLLAYSYAPSVLQPGDRIVITIAEHHSNLVPWQRAAQAAGAILDYMYLNTVGELSNEEIEQKIKPGTKIVAFTHVSNVLGGRMPVEQIVKRAKQVGAATVLDCAQSVPHMPINLSQLGVDFAAFSAHKLYAPMGVGVLYGRHEKLEAMPPFLSGGDMIEYVEEQHTTYAPLPQKFEAGTQNIEGVAGLAAAIDYIESAGWEQIDKIESHLIKYTLEGMAENPHIQIFGNPDPNAERYGVIAFNVEGVHPHDVASILDADGIAIRVGHHCAQPLLKYLGINACCRVSFGIYNTTEEVDTLLQGLQNVRRRLGYGD